MDDGEAIERQDVAANGLTFSLLTAGPPDGRPVVLLHGFPQTSWCWRAQLGVLGAAGHRALAPDQRGYSAGARPAEVNDYGTEHLVADVVALADALDVATFDLVGHDWGGMVSWLVAARHPDRVRSLSVVSTPHPLALRLALLGADPGQAGRAVGMDLFRRPEVPEKLLGGDDGRGGGLRRLLESSGLAPEAVEEYVGALTQPGALTAALNWYRAMDSAQLTELPPLTVPTLYVWSTGDAGLGRTAAEATGVYVSGPYEFVVLDDVSHWIPEMAPVELSERILAHLAATSGPGPVVPAQKSESLE
ncbi:MAG: alpha/beta fold hydrolase [Acidimicrobiales bacterium]